MDRPVSAPSGPRPTASEILGRLLSKEEYVAVITYAHERNLTGDDMVLFLVAMLKLFDGLFDEMVDVVDIAEKRRTAFEQTVASSAQAVADTLDQNITRLSGVLRGGDSTLAQHRGELCVAIGEIKALTEQLRTVTRDAREAFAAHEALRGDGHTLSDTFRTAALQALQRHVPGYGGTLREQLAAEVRRVKLTVVLTGLGLAAVLALLVAAMARV